MREAKQWQSLVGSNVGQGWKYDYGTDVRGYCAADQDSYTQYNEGNSQKTFIVEALMQLC